MKVISIINYKGGVGKTTLTANLAGELAWRNYKVLLIDLDPQSNLTFSFIKPEIWERDFANSRTIKNWFDSIAKGTSGDLSSLIFQPPVTKNSQKEITLDLIASHLGLINVDLELATDLGGASLKQAKLKYLKVHGRLAQGLKGLDNSSYDFILIDCPPNFNIVTKNAIVASDHILIPAKPDYLSTLGIDYLIRSLNELIKNYNEYVELDDVPSIQKIEPTILGVVFTMVQEYSQRPIAALRPYMSQTRKLNIHVYDSYIKENKSLFADAPQYGVPVVLTSPYSDSHRSVVEGITEFVAEFIDSLGEEED